MQRRLATAAVGMALAVCLGVVSIAASDPGDDSRTDPVFSVDVAVGPTTGPIHIPPADAPSRPYVAMLRVRLGPDGKGLNLRTRALYAGERVSETGTFDGYRVAFGVEIDRSGESAEVRVDITGDDERQMLNQRFVAHLPASQLVR
jgi:hypothetical protein